MSLPLAAQHGAFSLATHVDHIYLREMGRIYSEGERRTSRTGTDTISLFGDVNMKFDMRAGFPLVTTKFVHFKSIVHELLWMLSGSTNVRYLKENKVRIWDEWVQPETAEYKTLTLEERIAKLPRALREDFDEVTNSMMDDGRSHKFIAETQHNILESHDIPEKELVAGELGPVYGKQWRFWEDTRVLPKDEFLANIDKYNEEGFIFHGNHHNDIVVHRMVDQIARIEHQLKNDPESRRIILSGWNVAMLDEMALPPCHSFAQWFVSNNCSEEGKRYLDCKLYMRSNDIFLGCCFNIAQYALLTLMFAQVHGFEPRFYHHSIGDAHIYANHEDAVLEQMSRAVKHAMPTVKIEGTFNSILDIKAENIVLCDYQYQPAIKAKVAV